MIVNKKNYSIGLDVGGTKMTGCLFDGEKVVTHLTLATPQENLEKFIIMAMAIISPLQEEAVKNKIKIKGIGIGVPGILDVKRERGLIFPNLKILNNILLGDIFEKKTGIKTVIENDANCFSLAEALLGAGKKYTSVCGITIGTGIGGGWIYDKKIYIGKNGGSFEPGHIIIDENIDLEKAYKKLMGNNPLEMAEMAYRQDILAKKNYYDFGIVLGKVLANIANLIDPEIFIIGGSVIDSGDLFLKQTEIEMKKNIISPVSKKIKITKSKIGPLAGAIGASLLVL